MKKPTDRDVNLNNQSEERVRPKCTKGSIEKSRIEFVCGGLGHITGRFPSSSFQKKTAIDWGSETFVSQTQQKNLSIIIHIKNRL